MQEENGESSFEFVEKRSTEVASLSNIAPPSELPSFIIPSLPATPSQQSKTITSPQQLSTVPISNQSEFYPTKFTPAIPLETPPSSVPMSSCTTPITSGTEALPEGQTSSLFGWMKDTVSQQSQSIFSKVAEKAKHSVDTMITTLDPQMREFIGTNKSDMTIIVASDKEVKVSPVREAIQGLFPSAAVSGIDVYPRCAAQPVGFEAASKAANSRIRTLREMHNIQGPIVVVENFIVEVMPEKWYDIGLIVLDDNIRECQLETYTQMVPIPPGIVHIAQSDTPSDYEHKNTGYSVTIGSLMAKNLETDHTEWQLTLSGVSRRQMILSAAKVIANLYKTVLS